MNLKLWLLLGLLATLPAQAQRAQRVTIYFDSTRTHPREIFRALVGADTVLNGPYKRFYYGGRLEAQTRYTDNKRDSVYVEFHPRGGRRLEATYRAGVRQGAFKTYYDNGKPAQEGTFLDDEPSGPLTTYYLTGEIKLQTTLVKGQPNGAVRELYASGQPAAEVTYVAGQANGAAKFYYPSGKLQSEGSLRNGLLASSFKTYYETGQLESETTLDEKTGRGTYRSLYPSGKLQTEGTYAPAAIRERAVTNPRGDELTKRLSPPRTGTASLDGEATSYYESGKVRGKITYRLGVPTGHALGYFESGLLREETDYGNQGRDRRVVRYYDAAGQSASQSQPKQAEESYKNNRPAGTWREFYPDGATPRQLESYGPTGKLSGERLTYFQSGKVQTRQLFDPATGQQTGAGQEFYVGGQLRKEATYLKGILSGPYREQREDGAPQVAGQYKNGRQSGDWIYYKPSGGVERQVTYRDGRPQGTGSRLGINGKPFVPKRGRGGSPPPGR